MVMSSKLIVCLVTVAALWPSGTDSSRILGFFPFCIYSHQVPFFNVFDELVARGHEVTLVSGFPLSHTDHLRYKWVQLPIPIDKSKNPLGLTGMTGQSLIRTNSDFCLHFVERLVTVGPEFLNFIHNDTGSYDVIISEITFCGHIHSALAHKYGAPLVNFHALGYQPAQFSLLGGLLPPGAAPDIRLPFTDRMSYWERAYSAYMYALDLWELHHYMIPHMETLMNKVYTYPGSEARPPLISLLHNISLSLAEYDPRRFGISFPVPPNILFVGGLHLRPAKALPSRLEQFMSGPGRKGVIFVSLGTVLQFSHLEKRVVDAFVFALRQVEYGVIWKVDMNITMPDHVLTGEWFPQEDILGHPNCKLFITHAGIHSTMETVHYSVPVVVMPGFYDQFQNAKVMEQNGIGVITPMETITGDNLYLSIQDVMNNSLYRANVKRLSRRMHSVPGNNLDLAVQWTEFVADNQGAPGLSPESSLMRTMDLLCLDLLLWGFFFFVLVLTAVIISIWCICCLVRGSGRKTDQ